MDKRLAVLPIEFLERVAEIIPEKYQQRVYQSFCEKRLTTFRTNRLKNSTADVIRQLEAENIPFTRVPWYEDAFILKDVPQKTLTGTKMYTEGNIYIQSLSSMIPPLVMDPKKGDVILDMTAAPGSKTTQIASMMQNTGMIIANDKSHARMYKLVANLKLQGVTNTKTLQLPGQMLWKRFPETFDHVLVDTPCTMEGRFNCDLPKTYQDWTIAKIRDLVQTQRSLLRSAVTATKKGGTIIYSTCTLEPEENEGIIDWILEKEKGNLIVSKISFSLPDTYPAITTWHGKTFDNTIHETIRILPSVEMEGFYIAKLTKIG